MGGYLYNPPAWGVYQGDPPNLVQPPPLDIAAWQQLASQFLGNPPGTLALPQDATSPESETNRAPIQLAAIGDQPPWPPGYDPHTWQMRKWDDGRWELTDPERQRHLPHAEDKGHWRHWDIQGPGGDDRGSWPRNKRKVWSTQKRSPYDDQSAEDPNGDAPPWQPPLDLFAPLPERLPAVPGTRSPWIRIPGVVPP